MSGRTEAVLFDAGGVLWDLRPSPEDIFADALARRGVAVGSTRLREAMNKADRQLDDEFARLDARHESFFWRRYDGVVLGELGVGLDEEAFAKDLSLELRSMFAKVESWVPFPDAVPALERARKLGLKTGLVSNATELARRVLRNLDMERLFDVIVISEEVGVRKPDPEIFRIALDRAGSSPSGTVFLGDKPATDIRGAERAGIRGILVDRRDTFPDSGLVRMMSLDDLGRHLVV